MQVISISLPDSLLQYLDQISNGNRSHFIRLLLQSHQQNQSQSNIKKLIQEEFTLLLKQHNITPTELQNPNTKLYKVFSDLANQMMSDY